MISEATKARFAREVAKYPADQKQSAVMACLAIVQQEQGYVSEASEAVIADYLGMPQIAVHEVTTFYNMYNQHARGQVQTQRLHQSAMPAARRRQGAWTIWSTSWAYSMARPRQDGLFTLQQC
jgi:NADH-quinone oxidoreductase subunit E